MEVEEYVTARYGRLLERAVELGCPEGQASEYVDLVLRENRRQIQRAEDPDPLVLEALERAVRKEPRQARSPWPVVAVGLLGVAVAVGVALTYDPPPKEVPSLFGYDGKGAQALLEAGGYDVVVRPARACEPRNQVLSSQPRAGDKVAEGAPVTVRVAVPSGGFCDAQYRDRSDAWAFVAFALGGAAPAFADTVRVVVDGEPAQLTSGDAARAERWGGTLRLLEDAARAPAPTTNGMPSLTVLPGIPPERTCGIDRPIQGGERGTLRLQIDARADGDTGGCPLTVDLYRADRVIDAVVVYTAED